MTVSFKAQFSGFGKQVLEIEVTNDFRIVSGCGNIIVSVSDITIDNDTSVVLCIRRFRFG